MPRKQTIQLPSFKPHAKLDSYDYSIVPTEKEGIDIIKVKVISNRDVTIADISSDIVANDKRIYVEGRRYWYLTSFTSEDDNGQTYFELHVRRQYEGVNV